MFQMQKIQFDMVTAILKSSYDLLIRPYAEQLFILTTENIWSANSIQQVQSVSTLVSLIKHCTPKLLQNQVCTMFDICLSAVVKFYITIELSVLQELLAAYSIMLIDRVANRIELLVPVILNSIKCWDTQCTGLSMAETLSTLYQSAWSTDWSAQFLDIICSKQLCTSADKEVCQSALSAFAGLMLHTKSVPASQVNKWLNAVPTNDTAKHVLYILCATEYTHPELVHDSITQALPVLFETMQEEDNLMHIYGILGMTQYKGVAFLQDYYELVCQYIIAQPFPQLAEQMMDLVIRIRSHISETEWKSIISECDEETWLGYRKQIPLFVLCKQLPPCDVTFIFGDPDANLDRDWEPPRKKARLFK